MNIVEFNIERHYPTLCRYWKAYGWIPCPMDALPKHGRVAENAVGHVIAFMAAYIEDGTIAVVDWALADPNEPDDVKHLALQKLFAALVDLSRSHGCHYVYSFTKNKGWGRRMESYGMLVAEREATTYVMPLSNTDTAFIRD